MDANIKKDRERILEELMKYSYAGLVKVAVFKLKDIIDPKPEEPENLLASSGCACGGECGCYSGA